MAWKRSDKIAAVALVVTVIVAVGLPVARAEWGDSHKPSATLRTPSPGEKIKSPFDSQGTWKHISASEDLWLIIRSGKEGRWYPVARLHRLPDHTWKTTGKAIRPAIGPQEIHIFLVPLTADATLLDYLKIRGDPGLSRLPSEARRLKTVEVTVL